MCVYVLTDLYLHVSTCDLFVVCCLHMSSFSQLVIHRAGDHKQLGPVVPERNLCSPYVNILKMPFLERMLKNPRRWEARRGFTAI